MVLVRGDLYYMGSRALEDADGADDIYAEPKADANGVCRRVDVRWLHPSVPKADVERAFEQFGPIQYVWMRSGEDWMDPPVQEGRLGDFSYNYATVIFHNKPDARGPTRRPRARRSTAPRSWARRRSWFATPPTRERTT